MNVWRQVGRDSYKSAGAARAYLTRTFTGESVDDASMWDGRVRRVGGAFVAEVAAAGTPHGDCDCVTCVLSELLHWQARS